MSQLIIFNELKTQLAAITGVKHVALWNNQPDNERQENPFLYPAIFIEFTNDNFVDMANGVQKFDSIITLHVCFESYKDEDADILTLKDSVYKSTHRTQNTTTSSMLLRVDEDENFDHSNVQDYMQMYKTSITDYGTDTRPTKSKLVTTLVTPIAIT